MAEHDTIAGVATGTPDGGVAIVRISGPRALELAEAVRLRQGVGTRFPLSSDLGAERRTWRNLSSTRPVDTPAERALPAVPEWAPTTPTLIPAECWEPCATVPGP